MTEQKKINSFLAFLKLIRFENLLIIAATQYLFRYFVFNGLFSVPDKAMAEFFNLRSSVPSFTFANQLSHFNFFLLVLSTTMIAAAGYIINDYFDVKTDRINRPDKIVIDRGVKRRVAMAAHTVINILGIFIGIYVGWRCGNYQLGMVHILTAGLLWFYSTNFKKMFFVGNLLVAFLAGLVPIVIAIFETHLLNYNSRNAYVLDPVYKEFINSLEAINFNVPIYFAAGLGLFAFLLNLMRELVKDMEDFVGDMETGGETVPIKLGYKQAKNIVHGINFLTISVLLYVLYKLWIATDDFVWYKLHPNKEDLLSVIYLFVLVILPLIVFSFMLRKSDAPKKFRQTGMFLKFVMLAGILYAAIIWFNFSK